MHLCKKHFFLWLTILISATASGQKIRLKGTVTNENNEPFPFVSVFIQGTTDGTSSNADGNFYFDLPAGTYPITFRYIGYQSKTISVTLTRDLPQLAVQLLPQAVEISQVSISAGGEDPAYPIIRKAQRKRKFYLTQVRDYSYNSYIKGITSIRNIPEKLLGRDIVIDGLDSTRSGIVYLSESVSEVFFKAPDNKKEKMISSKVSGKSQGFSWNSALDFQLNFYEPLIPTPVTDRDVVSPIAPDAMTYYTYELMGEFNDQGKRVFRIQVTPKVTGSPMVNGIINIQDSTWRIHSIDMFLTKNNAMNFLDTLRMKVIFIPVTADIWMKGTQDILFNFDFKLFKVQGDGNFTGIFSNYNLQPEYPKNFFTAEVLRIDEESNKKSDAYWDSIRPVELTTKEALDYELKDSLELIRETKTYKDSVDRIQNRFKWTDILTGYTWENSYREIELGFSSPLRNLNFNTVEGFNLAQTISFSKFYREIKARTDASATVRYGFDGGRLYYKGSLRHRFNATNRMEIAAEGGTYIVQYNQQNPITELQNTIYTVLMEDNFIKLYEKSYGKLRWKREVFNGITVETSFEFARRRARTNAPGLTPFFVNWDSRTFTSNDPQDAVNNGLAFANNNVFLWNVGVEFKFGQKYMMRPGIKINYRTKWPIVELQYTKAIPGVLESAPDYDFIRIGLSQQIDLGIIGFSEYHAAYGMFINRNNVPFTDFHHFNTTQVIFAPADPLRSFWALPYYRFSTSDKFVEVHYQHHFQGLLLGKIPFIKKLKWHEVAGFHFLWTPALRDYYEFTVGIENIFRIIRADFVGAFRRGADPYFSGRVKIDF